jgi:kynurenine formamidase
MNVFTEINQQKYQADLSKPLDISLPIREGLTANPSCYWAEAVQFDTITMGSFVGSVKQGGSVNYQRLIITPHGNGTHTECVGHISADPTYTLNSLLPSFHFTAQLISLTPQKSNDGDTIISLDQVKEKFQPGVKALIIRTIPNPSEKKTLQYSGTNPAYMDADVLRFLVENGVDHFLIDLPSIDKEVDGGKLAAHKAFWKYPESIRKHATITELVYADNSIQDGLYLLNLQIISLEMDASPSKPVLYKLTEVL